MTKFTGNALAVKRINRSLILQAIRAHGPISRTDLSKITNLTSGTISNLTAELLKSKLIKEVGVGMPTGGRRPILLDLNSKAWYIIGLHVENRDVVCVVTDLDANITCRIDGQIELDWDTERQIDEIVNIIERAIEGSNIRRESFLGMGIGIPGLIDSRAGKSIFSLNLGWENVMIKDILESRIKIPVMVEHAVRLETLGEKWWGAGKGRKNVVTLHIGSGVGAGYILDDKLYSGTEEAAGEIGHIIVSEDGPQCNCGRKGCLEAITSESSIAHHAKKEILSGKDSVLKEMCKGDLDSITGEMVTRAAIYGDKVASDTLIYAGRYIGKGVSILINLLNPDIVLLNGAIFNAESIIIPEIMKTVEEEALTVNGRRSKVEVSKLKELAGPLGGVAIVTIQLFTVAEIERVSRVS